MFRPQPALLAVALMLSGCAIRHATPYVPDASNAPQTAAGSDTSADCVEAAAPAEQAICRAPNLGSANRAMLEAFQQDIRTADLFARDSLIASQRVWLLGLSAQCHLPTSPASEGESCLQSALAERKAALQAWHEPPARSNGVNAFAQYVNFHAAAGAGAQPAGALCETIAQRANAAIARIGSADPAVMGAEEIAGTHGQQSADSPLRVSVDLYDANGYALFQRRARSVSIAGAAPVITPISLTELVRAQSTANAGGRFSAYASQTGDYGATDVFRLDGRILVLAADPWGSTTPAAQGEAAHAGVWNITTGTPAPACLFDIYTRPADPGAFETLPNFTAWRDTLNQIRDSAILPLGNAARRDQSLLSSDTNFILLHMPLLAIQQANATQWTPWLRHRHDAVLDTLFAWSARDPANKPLFDKLFNLQRAAAQDLVHAYQTTEALGANEATQATALTIMELLYGATVNIAPGLGSDLGGPLDAAGIKPRYAILASPQ